MLDKFKKLLAQTSLNPIGFEVSKAQGVYIYDEKGNSYIDLAGGFSVSNLGHQHPAINKAITEQLSKYLHVMVYGEFIQKEQIELADLLTKQLPASLNNVYYTCTGTEAVEVAIKLAKRYTKKPNTLSFSHAYHGSTQGSLTVLGDEYYKQAYKPLIPGNREIKFNDTKAFEYIDESTACVIIEPIQGEAGIIEPMNNFLIQLQQHCQKTSTLLIFDEIQTGFGRTGSLFAFEQFGVIPDILLIGKAFGGGLPLAACIADKQLMLAFTENPHLGHITTFGGHALSCVAAYASLQEIIKSNLSLHTLKMEQLFKNKLQHPLIKGIRGRGLFLSVDLDERIDTFKFIRQALKFNLILEGFLFNPNAIRITPPLIISESETSDACKYFLQCLNNYVE
jgi:acetylornithine/N-succinyldiaminopimelate aminotransferase